PSHASAVEGNPHATLRGTGERGNQAGRQGAAAAAAALRPTLETRAVESDETIWCTEPEIAVEVLGDCEYVTGLFVGPGSKRVADRGRSVAARGRKRWQG